jgi:hypothetical protein
VIFSLLAISVIAASAALNRVAAAEPLFAAPFLSFGAGGDPRSVAIGDLNGDGKPDLVVANYTSHTVSVLLGKGDGTFRGKTDSGVGSHPSSVAIGDLNGDGKPDLVATNSNSSTVSALLGNGDGTFGAKTDFGVGSYPSSVAIGDLNGDGRPDLAVANSNSSAVSVLFGNGDGTFSASIAVETGIGATSVAIGDLNGDGKPDMAVARTSSTVLVLLGDGDGTFEAKADFGVGNFPFSAAIGDLNGDGKLDLATANYGSSTASVLLGNGDGTFGAKMDRVTGDSPYSVAIGDLDADGKPDLATANYGSNTVSVLLGNGDGASWTLGAKTDFVTGHEPYAVEIGDLNEDGKSDLATANYGSNTVSVLLGNGDGTFGKTTDFGSGDDAACVAVGDMNRDGKPDLVTANWGPNTVSVLLGNGTGTSWTRTDYEVGMGPNSVAFADLNGDGVPDLAVANLGSYYDRIGNTVSVLLGNGDGTFGARTDYETGIHPFSVAIGDLNGDGKPDLVTANYREYSSAGNTVSVLLGDGNGAFGAKTDFVTGSGPTSVAIADLNGDGHPDLAAANSYSNTVSVLLGDGTGALGVKTDFVGGGSPFSVAIGDLNGDGSPDLAVANMGSSTVSVLLGNGNGTFGVRVDHGTGGGGAGSVAIGDLNGDGHPDLAVANNYGSGAPGGTVSVLLGNGNGTFGVKTDYGTGGSAGFAAIGDLNEDGKPDLVTANGGMSTISVLFNIGPDIPTPTLVELFRAVPTEEGIRVEWQLSNPGSFQLVALQRGTSEAGPWSPVQQAPQVQGQVTSVLDDAAPAGQTRWYRLRGLERDGHSITLGLISVMAQEAITAFALSQLSPNPSTGHSLVTFAIPARTWVRLTLTDVQGREVAVLADGVRQAGRYTAALDASDLRAGMYFVRMQAQGVDLTRRLAVVK